MSEAPDPHVELPWRKRHPVFSRMVLYVLGLLIIAGLVHLFLERQKVDEQDRLDALAHELDALATLHELDPDGTLVLEALDERFSDRDLPVQLQGRSLRWRALAHRKREAREPMEAAYEAAAALDLPPRERVAMGLEWAESRLAFRDREGALAVLPATEQTRAALPLDLLRTLLAAQALHQQGAEDEAARLLQEALDGLSAPLPADVRVYVGGRDWVASEVATVMTEWLARLPGADGYALSRRLRALGPTDFTALRVAASGFLAAGRTEEAAATWAEARALDAREADAVERQLPALQALRAPQDR